MIKGLILASYGFFGGGSIGNLLAQWEAAGVFNFVLPFLLIFAIVFGLLQKLQLFGQDQKPINAIIALATSLMSLQFNFVGVFFSEIFPRMGVGLSILLVVMILFAVFYPNKSFDKMRWPLIIVAGIIILVVVFTSLESLGWVFGFRSGAWGLYNVNWSNVILIALVIGAVLWVLGVKAKKSPEAPKSQLEGKG